MVGRSSWVKDVEVHRVVEHGAETKEENELRKIDGRRRSAAMSHDRDDGAKNYDQR